MPQTKYNCKTCRRLVSIESAFCPFCNTPNEHYKGNRKEDNPADAASLQPDQEKQKPVSSPVQPKKVPSPKPSRETPVPEPISDDTAEEVSLESLEHMYSRVPVTPTTLERPNREDPPESDSESIFPQDEDPLDANHSEEHENTISSSGEVHRSPIDWQDSTEKPETEYTEMFDEKGVYQANYDGYYNDTLPKIANEIDRALANREKIILKGIFSVVAVVAIIIYLIITV